METNYRFTMISLVVQILYLVLVSTSKVDQLTLYCEKNATCTTILENSYCDFVEKLHCGVGVCNCLPTHIAVVKDASKPETITCLRKPLMIGDNCEHDQQCTSAFGEFSSCTPLPSGVKCQCTNNTVYCPVGGCRSRRTFGDSCYCTEQCNHITGAICYEPWDKFDPARCTCREEEVEAFDGTTCLKKANRLGQPCDVHPDQCRDVTNSVCDPVAKACICKDSWTVPHPQNTSCLPKRNLLNMECQQSVQCLVKNSICDLTGNPEAGFCRCGENLVPSSIHPDLCLQVALSLDSECTEDVQCKGVVVGDWEMPMQTWLCNYRLCGSRI